MIIHNARILTIRGGPEPRRERHLHELGAIERGYIRIEDDRITAVHAGHPAAGSEGEMLDAGGCVVLPAFVDCHTHACWAGNRFDEFELRLAGADYLEILKAGGGIMSTVRAVRDASEIDLVELLLRRVWRMSELGTGAMEIKSGYGLDTPTELKMLRAIMRVAAQVPHLITPTFLGAHAIDPDNPDFITQTIDETLPAVATEFPAITCDAYCEQGAWSLDDTRRLFEAAADAGCPLRVHADQFHSLGMTRLAVEMGAVSVDHLEATTPDDLLHLAHSSTIGVALPCSGFSLDDRYAPARAFVDAGGALAIATNYNPGSSPTPSMPFTIALACRKLHLTPAEAIVAATHNAACVLGLQNDLGSLQPHMRANVQILDCEDERELAYEFAGAGPRVLILNGRVVHQREPAMGVHQR